MQSNNAEDRSSQGSGRRRGGDLEITSETTLAEVPRGREGREALRVRHLEAVTADGRPISWTDIREFYRPDDSAEWRPGKKGISIRARELGPVTEALRKVIAGQTGPAATAARPESDADIPF
jgi:hypothetical protein